VHLPRALVDPSEEHGAEVARPHAVVHLLQADVVLLQRVREGRELVAEADRPGVGHPLHGEVARVLERGQPVGVGARRRRVARPRRVAGQRGASIDSLAADLGRSAAPTVLAGARSGMAADDRGDIVFKRLPEVDPADLIALMNDPRVRRHLPLARAAFGPAECARFVAAKERLWAEHGYGPWAFVIGGEFAGWGGLQPEGGEVDLGLVLRPEHWGVGRALYERLLTQAFDEMRLASVIILLPPSRVRVSGVLQLGFRPDGELQIAEERFVRYRLLAPARRAEAPPAGPA
jgi:[ribosomal protein S5]-alanine N-acetyltransferase